MEKKKIAIISFGYFDNEFLLKLTDKIRKEFFEYVKIREGHIDLSDFYDYSRRQYDANKLLQHIDKNFSSLTLKTIGLFSVDLFIPIFTYIFGQAYLNGQTGIASLYRLSNERYGLKPDDNLLLERFNKEIIHELGHTFGLIHCHMPECVMRSSSYVEDVDQKNATLCPNCKKLIQL